MLSTTIGMSGLAFILKCCLSRFFVMVFSMHLWRRKTHEDYGMLTHWW
jgi:hypothetical protein